MLEKTILRGQVFLNSGEFQYGEIVIGDGFIEEVNLVDEDVLSFEERNQKIIPGLVDIHMHGAVNQDVCTCDADGFKKIAKYELENGITSFCPATMTLSIDNLINICSNISDAMLEIPLIKGIYLEGPFISPKRCGAQNIEHIKSFDGEILDSFMEASRNNIRVVVVAPEVNDTVKAILEYKDRHDVTPLFSIGHTVCDYDMANKAFKAGIKHITHLYNAMPSMLHRSPGLIGAAADSDNVIVELICDGVHVDPSMVRSTYKLFGADRIVLVSDSMMATGMGDGEYILADQKVTKTGNKAVLSESKDKLAGSVSNLFQCMVNAIKYGIPEEDAIILATKNPAKAIGIYDIVGSIEKGKRADLLLINSNYDILRVYAK